MNRTTRKKKASPAKDKTKEADEKLKVETLKEEQLFKALPRDLQWEILSEYLGTHVVRSGKLMRRFTGDVQAQLLKSLTQKEPPRMRQPLRLNLKTVPMKSSNSFLNRESWAKYFDTKPGVRGYRTLAVVEDSKGTPYYRYTSHIDGQDDVEISTPLDNSIVLAPFTRKHYPSNPNSIKKLGRNHTSKLYDPTKVSTGYNPV